MSGAYYNEIEPFAAQWLRNLIARGLIAAGDVDERSIVDVQPEDLRGYDQCHFFAGIGGWSLALRIAGWPDDRPVWTGSCPCQPFSVAGSQRGVEDERHLWPAWFRLIRERRPPTVFGEQVAGAAGLAWLDLVCADLEDADYAVGAADLPACGVGAPHRRQRLYFVADDLEHGLGRIAPPRIHERRPGAGGDEQAPGNADGALRYDADGRGVAGGMGDSTQGGLGIDGGASRQGGHPALANAVGRLGDASGTRPQGRDRPGDVELYGAAGAIRSASPSGISGAWDDLVWLPCSDGKARPTQPGLFPLAHGIPGRVGRLRAYGNAIVPPLAAMFIRTTMPVKCGAIRAARKEG